MAPVFGGDQTMQIHGDFEGFPPIHWPEVIVHCLSWLCNDPCKYDYHIPGVYIMV